MKAGGIVIEVLRSGKTRGRLLSMYTTCSAPNCERPSPGRKYCNGHKSRLDRTGMLGEAPIKDIPPHGITGWAVVEWNGWDVTATGCWEYRGPKFANGYGQIKIYGTPTLLHRVSYEHFIGPIPPGLLIRHKCDNKPCMNPDHLEVGTNQDNVNDMHERGRRAYGHQGRGVITDERAVEIREEISMLNGGIMEYINQVAAEEGVHPSTVHKIWLRNTYFHLPGGYKWTE